VNGDTKYFDATEMQKTRFQKAIAELQKKREGFKYNLEYEELDSSLTRRMIQEHQSFTVIGLGGKILDAVSVLENIIETEQMSCRIYTYGRATSAGASLISGIASVAGVASTIGIVAHNLATLNPDYEIAKHLVDHKLSVTYKK